MASLPKQSYRLLEQYEMPTAEHACSQPESRKQLGMTNPLENPLPLESPTFFDLFTQTRSRMREVRSQYPARWRDVVSGTPANPKVSIMVITYNHEHYIRQAIDSILMQERDFEIEINVIDDCSSDNTQRIAREYQLRYPGVIHCYFNERNVGHIATQLNTLRGFQTLRGDYFALLEGDDYWTDRNKLNEQVCFLDEHMEYVACAHNTLKIYDDGRPPEHFLPFKTFNRERATIADLVTMSGVYHLSSIVYRNVFGLNPPRCLASPYSCEVTINMLYGQFGDFYCIDKYMSAYRVHDSGVFSSRTTENIWLFHLGGYRHFMIFLGWRYWALFSRAVFGFSRYALLANRRSVGPRLTMKSKMIFVSHLLIASMVYGITGVTTIMGRQYVRGHIRTKLSMVYRRFLSILPDRAIHRYLAAELKIPIIRRLRLACKRRF